MSWWTPLRGGVDRLRSRITTPEPTLAAPTTSVPDRAEPAPVGATDPGPELPSVAAWAGLPPVQRSLREPIEPVASLDAFSSSLATHQNPSFLAPLSHRVDPGAGGLVDGLADLSPGTPRTYAPSNDLTIRPTTPPPAPTKPAVQRVWGSFASAPELDVVPMERPVIADQGEVDQVADAGLVGSGTPETPISMAPPARPEPPSAPALTVSRDVADAEPLPPVVSSTRPVTAQRAVVDPPSPATGDRPAASPPPVSASAPEVHPPHDDYLEDHAPDAHDPSAPVEVVSPADTSYDGEPGSTSAPLTSIQRLVSDPGQDLNPPSVPAASTTSATEPELPVVTVARAAASSPAGSAGTRTFDLPTIQRQVAAVADQPVRRVAEPTHPTLELPVVRPVEPPVQRSAMVSATSSPAPGVSGPSDGSGPSEVPGPPETSVPTEVAGPAALESGPTAEVATSDDGPRSDPAADAPLSGFAAAIAALQAPSSDGDSDSGQPVSTPSGPESARPAVQRSRSEPSAVEEIRATETAAVETGARGLGTLPVLPVRAEAPTRSVQTLLSTLTTLPTVGSSASGSTASGSTGSGPTGSGPTGSGPTSSAATGSGPTGPSPGGQLSAPTAMPSAMPTVSRLFESERPTNPAALVASSQTAQATGRPGAAAPADLPVVAQRAQSLSAELIGSRPPLVQRLEQTRPALPPAVQPIRFVEPQLPTGRTSTSAGVVSRSVLELGRAEPAVVEVTAQRSSTAGSSPVAVSPGLAAGPVVAPTGPSLPTAGPALPAAGPALPTAPLSAPAALGSYASPVLEPPAAPVTYPEPTESFSSVAEETAYADISRGQPEPDREPAASAYEVVQLSAADPDPGSGPASAPSLFGPSVQRRLAVGGPVVPPVTMAPPSRLIQRQTPAPAVSSGAGPVHKSGAGSGPVSFTSMFAEAGDGAGAQAAQDGYTSVQLAGEDAPPASVPAPVEPPAPSPAAPAGAAPAAAAPTDLDEMARRLFEPLSARIRAELWLDRERSGLMTDARP